MSKPNIMGPKPSDKIITVTAHNVENLRLYGASDSKGFFLFQGSVTIEAATATEENETEKPLDRVGLSSLIVKDAVMKIPASSEPDISRFLSWNGEAPLSIQCEALEIQGTDNGEERTVTIADALVTFSGEMTWKEPEKTEGNNEENDAQNGVKVSSTEDEKLIFQGPMNLKTTSTEGFPVDIPVEHISIDAAVQYSENWNEKWDNAFTAGMDNTIEKGSVVITGGAACYDKDNSTLIISVEGKKGQEITVDWQDSISQTDANSQSESVTVLYDPSPASSATAPSFLAYLPFFALIAILAASLIISFIQIRRLHGKIQELKRRPDGKKPVTANASTDIPALGAEPASLTVKDIQNIGKRPSQQDCLGCISVQGGAFAVVADGMGGLSDGDKVSQKVVHTMLQDSANRSAAQLSENLLQLVAHANTEVNQMLGYKTYQSGSTLVAVVAERNSFRWVSIGDSRIYLYRAGGLLQMNREHVFKQELLKKAVNRELTFAEAQSPEEGKKVTSFIGMGEIKYIDQCLHPVRALPGDRLMLCSDGVFNALSEREIALILGSYQDAASAASAMEAAVLSKNEQYQDNFSAVLFFYA